MDTRRYNKILVGFDGSESSMEALLRAFTLAVDEKCWITVTTVVPSYNGDLDLTGVKDIHSALRRPGEKALSMAAETAKAEGVLIKTVLEEGEAHERIVDLAEAENAGIIVMGRRGTSALERVFIGSVTARVIGHSQRDILVVPNNSERRSEPFRWKKIILATDGSRYSATAADKALNFAKAYGGEINVVSVVDIPPEFYAEAHNAVDDLIKKAKVFVEDVRAKAEQHGVRASCFVGEGDADRVIADLARKEKADVIVMGSHGRTGLKRLLMGSVTERVIVGAQCPVLVVKR